MNALLPTALTSRPFPFAMAMLLAITGLVLAGPSAPTPSVKPIGGGYEGPGDTVPPGDDEHDIGLCDMPFGHVCEAVDTCPQLQWLPHPRRCTMPGLASTNPEPVWARLYTLSIREIVHGLRTGSMCRDEYGNITTCLLTPFPVSEIHIFESGWINGYYNQSAIQNAVPATVCVGGEVINIGWAFDELVKAQSCELTEICITFHADCMSEALLDWAMSGIVPSEWADSWLFAVDFVSCDPCDSGSIEPFPLD